MHFPSTEKPTLVGLNRFHCDYFNKVSKKRLWKVWLLLWASGARVSLDHSYLFVNENTCADNISLCNTWRSLMNNYNWLTIDNRLLLIHRDFKIGSLKKHRLKPRGFYSSIKEVYRIKKHTWVPTMERNRFLSNWGKHSENIVTHVM